ncbi:MAG: ABC transporter ATP-binding protein [Acidobacteriota bacterium]
MRLLVGHGVRGGYAGKEVVRGVDLLLEGGRCLALVGPNGAGKSTLLRLLAGILPLQAGTVELLGRPLSSWRRRELATNLGLVPQSVALTFPLTVRELVEQGRAPHLGPWRPPGAHDNAAVMAALDRVGLRNRIGEPVQQLSGGERQRALLARALASEPRVLLLDEPATALDVGHQLALVATLRSLLADGVGVLLVLHDWNLALRIANELLVLHHGVLHAAGPPDDILHPQLFADVFGVSVELLSTSSGRPVVVPLEELSHAKNPHEQSMVVAR